MIRIDLLPRPLILQLQHLRLRVLILELVHCLAQLHLEVLVLSFDLFGVPIQGVHLFFNLFPFLSLSGLHLFNTTNPLHLVLQAGAIDSKLEQLLLEIITFAF